MRTEQPERYEAEKVDFYEFSFFIKADMKHVRYKFSCSGLNLVKVSSVNTVTARR